MYAYVQYSRSYFNSRPCVRGDYDAVLQGMRGNKFQFTPLCEGRLKKVGDKHDFQRISIHAPV